MQAKWTDKILDEVFGNLTANRPDLDPQAPSANYLVESDTAPRYQK